MRLWEARTAFLCLKEFPAEVGVAACQGDARLVPAPRRAGGVTVALDDTRGRDEGIGAIAKQADQGILVAAPVPAVEDAAAGDIRGPEVAVASLAVAEAASCMTFQMSVASPPHDQALNSIGLIGKEVIPLVEELQRGVKHSIAIWDGGELPQSICLTQGEKQA
jgi:hypothetical protein